MLHTIVINTYSFHMWFVCVSNLIIFEEQILPFPCPCMFANQKIYENFRQNKLIKVHRRKKINTFTHVVCSCILHYMASYSAL